MAYNFFQSDDYNLKLFPYKEFLLGLANPCPSGSTVDNKPASYIQLYKMKILSFPTAATSVSP